MSIPAVYIDNSDKLFRDICTVDVFVPVLLVVLHVSGTSHNYPKYK